MSTVDGKFLKKEHLSRGKILKSLKRKNPQEEEPA
jgi:hypothetical protein